MIVVVDYGLGNLLSVTKALEYVASGKEVRLTSLERDIRKAERIVLPGVGNFGAGMENLRIRNLVETLREQVLIRGVPLLGICLGMQILGDIGEESGECKGL
ncbi:MAG: hypothetical protein JRH18_11715 [Deltaproteobacteria bacterium]|nr:hypothetical protein [Deltaproteobacteria bacterium]MBW2152325.1 hypothetical protein [Deltaproteobacteria bacterium]